MHEMTSRDRALSLAAVIVSSLFTGLAHGLAYPLTSIQFERWGEPGWVTGLAAGMPALAALVVLPITPWLAPRFGAVATMAAGCALGMLGFLAMPVWMTPEGWIVLRFVMGIGLTLPWLLSETWINAASVEETRGLAFGAYTVSLFGGFGAGPLLLDWMGPVEVLPFVVGAVALALSLLPLVAAIRVAPPIDQEATGGVVSMMRLVPVAMVAAVLAGAIEFSYMSLLPALGLREGLGDETALQFVTAFVWGGVAFSIPLGWLADKMDRTRLFLWLCVLSAALAAVLAGTMEREPSFAIPVTFVLGGMACAFYPTGLAILGERTSLNNLAAANAAFLILYQVGTLSGPPMAGAAMDAWAGHGLAGAMAISLAAAILMTMKLGRSRKQPQVGFGGPGPG